jgi:predicted MFS family arabinose efflux permease
VGSLALFFGVYGMAAIFMRLGGGRRYDRMPHRAVTVMAVAVQGIGLMLVGWASSVPVLAAGALLLGTAHGIVFPILSSQVVGRARTAERGSAVAMFTSVIDVGLLVVAPVVGFLIHGRGYGLAFSTVGLVLIGGAFLYLVWDRRSLPEPAPALR